MKKFAVLLAMAVVALGLSGCGACHTCSSTNKTVPSYYEYEAPVTPAATVVETTAVPEAAPVVYEAPPVVKKPVVQAAAPKKTASKYPRAVLK